MDSQPPVDPKAYYGYLFEQGDRIKKPSHVLDALLRAIGQYIIDEIGDKNDRALTPTKLAAFYHAVGGNYDSLFKEVPSQSISYIWMITGCQHTLQPVPGDDFAAPSIPALTLKGFVQWESVELLLGPEEHVPFLQHAVKNWGLKNPDTGEPFPTELPKEAFPAEPDSEVDRWHKECAERLRELATPREEPKPAFPESRVKDGYSHVRANFVAPSPRPRPESDYFNRPVSYTHVASRYPPSRSSNLRSPERERYRRGSSSDERAARRRSFSDYPSPPRETTQSSHASTHLAPHHALPPRRHSQPRHYSTSSDSDEPTSPRTKRRHHPHHSNDPPPPSVRRVFPPQHQNSAPLPSGPVIPPNAPQPSTSGARSSNRGEDPRRRSFPIPLEGFREKISSILPGIGGSTERPRSSSRSHGNGNGGGGNVRLSKDSLPGSRLSRSWSNEDEETRSESDSGDERDRRRRRRERERDRERDRDKDGGRDRGRDRERMRDRERDKERDRRDRDDDDDNVSPKSQGSRRDKYLHRPEVQRRTSSHADIDRRRDYPSWDNRDRDRYRDEKRRRDDRMPSPVVTGVGGRKYPTEPVWN